METGVISDRLKWKKLLATFVAILLAVSLQLTPLTEASKAFATDGETSSYALLAADDDTLGFEPNLLIPDKDSTLPDEILEEINTADYEVFADLPERWDMRETSNINHNQLTPVRNQNPFGVCWAFGYGQSIESATVRSGISPTQSYSEANWISALQLANAVYNEQTIWKPDETSSTNEGLKLVPMAGGSIDKLTSALSKWFGAVPESSAPWPFSPSSGNILFYAYLVGIDYEGEHYPGIDPRVVWREGFDPDTEITGDLWNDFDAMETVLRNAIWSESGTFVTSEINKDFQPLSIPTNDQTPYKEDVIAGTPILEENEEYTNSPLARAVVLDFRTSITEYLDENNLGSISDLIQELYIPSMTVPEIASQSDYHMQNTLLYPTNYTDEMKKIYSPENVEVVKQAIVAKGALQLTYSGTATGGETTYNPATRAQYVDQIGYQPDHSVAIVGWDNAFSATNFIVTAPTDGAFICKNSWGTEFGEEGYFYLSYYDKSISEITSFDVESSDNYDAVTYLDDTVSLNGYKYDGTSAWMANVFTAPTHNPVTIDAVGINTNYPNQSYEVKVYTNVRKGDAPTSGTLAASWTGETTYAGYFTYEAPTNQIAKANAGTNYAIVVKVTNRTGSEQVTLPAEGILHNYPQMDQTGYNFQVNMGESYLSNDGVAWKDVLKQSNRVTSYIYASNGEQIPYSLELGNFNLKAYTNYASADHIAFPDVAADAWYYPYVSYVAGHGLMYGYADSGNFGPEHTTTRGQVATVLYRLEGSPVVSGSSGFPDVPDGMFYSDPISWARDVGVVTGYTDTGNFRPDREVTREEMATLLARYASLRGIDITVDDIDGVLSGMQDAASISGWAREYAAWCAQEGIMTGKEMGGGIRLADPAANLTRAELAKMLTVVHRDVLITL